MIAAILCLALIACRDNKQAIESEMQSYSRLLLHKQYDSMVQKFIPRGELAGEGMKSIFGRDSLTQMFKGFADVTVLKYETTSKSIEMKGEEAVQEGSYVQTVVVPSGDTLFLGGDFTTTWVKSENKWMIKRMSTQHYKKLP